MRSYMIARLYSCHLSFYSCYLWRAAIYRDVYAAMASNSQHLNSQHLNGPSICPSIWEK